MILAQLTVVFHNGKVGMNMCSNLEKAASAVLVNLEWGSSFT